MFETTKKPARQHVTVVLLRCRIRVDSIQDLVRLRVKAKPETVTPDMPSCGPEPRNAETFDTSQGRKSSGSPVHMHWM